MLLYLGFCGFLGRHIDGGSVIRIKLDIRAHRNLCLDGVVGLLLSELGLLTVVDLADGYHIELLYHHGLGFSEKSIRGFSKNSLTPNNSINNGARSTATTETLERIPTRDVLIGLRYGSVNVFLADSKVGNKKAAFGLLSGNCDVQRSSSV